MNDTTCSKCGGGMEEEFVADNNLTNVIPSIWVAGAPESSFWTGTAGAKVAGKAKRHVQSYRCTACGYLESFATAAWPGA